MNNRFPILSFVSMLLKFFGWLFVVIGILYAVGKGIIVPMNSGGHFDLGDLLSISTGFGLTISGLIIAAIGEIIGVLFAIEENTRRACNAVLVTENTQNRPISHFPGDTEQSPIFCTNCGAKIEASTFECVACGTHI